MKNKSANSFRSRTMNKNFNRCDDLELIQIADMVFGYRVYDFDWLSSDGQFIYQTF